MAQRLLKAVNRHKSAQISALSLLKHTLKSANRTQADSWEMPDTALQLQFPINSDDGESLKGYFSMYRTGKGPAYVQVEFNPSATSDYADFKSLSLCVTCACAWIPLSNGSLVIKADAEDLSEQQKGLILAKVRREIEGLIGEKVTLSEDVKLLNYAKAAGAWSMLSSFYPSSLQSTPQITLLHTFSPLQCQLLSYLPKDWLLPVAATEASGGTINLKGIDVDLLIKHYMEHGTVKGFDGGETFNSLGKVTFAADVVIAEKEWNSALRPPKLLIELNDCLLSSIEEQELHASNTLILPSQLSNIGEAVVGFAAAMSTSRALPEVVYRQWTTWLGVKQVQSLETLIHTSKNSAAYANRLGNAVETVSAGTAFRIGWKQTKEGGSLRALAASEGLNYLSKA
jgi:hypothetical protein